MDATTKINIPESDLPRIVIVGGGFGGLKLARKLSRSAYQVVLIDKNNYHQFQPLFYQVAMAGLEPSSIVFPFRKLFQGKKNVYIRVTEVTRVDPAAKRIHTPFGHCNYDHLIVATGADTNFFGNANIAEFAIPMKSVSEALYLRNNILDDYEDALTTPGYDSRQELVDIVIVGGGPTGVELAGSLAEMKKHVLPKDYPELNIAAEVDIYLIQSGGELLKGFSAGSSAKALRYLTDMGVKVLLDSRVTDFDGHIVSLQDGRKIPTQKVIWAAGIKGAPIPGLPETALTFGNRLAVDPYLRLAGVDNIYAIGDVAYLEEAAFPKGHPQVAQVAIQMGDRLARNFARSLDGKDWEPFHYRDKGSMATVGRARAVVDLLRPEFHFGGIMAWLVWLLVHLFAILGTRNKLFVFVNWVANYINYNQSLRLIIRPTFRKGSDGVGGPRSPDISG
ncbi:NAD(P)/FAD-dependent oxidoreductase [Neolewinella lacunae]|uniref:NADH:ubiquinone reductase (non-electrogenic) n=1 Tax=Neolewinella lacunae TaxID=1517758 RepID=A0A923T7G1_9BACT|nr:NAD(P)/FAD-dependent oxidoreductase [Neolewinella lacunae]MBC6994465.1 NAD(P)/FAD-dependent oxidoreductase [Neolewinella lacunae]MDN3634158.1 NAD(P)/FAD-dependent oxidoreductase [Neolewinella lacunae]